MTQAPKKTDSTVSVSPQPQALLPETQHWSVTVERNGEQVVTIESNCLAGRDISAEDEATIRKAAHHLLSFIGDPHASFLTALPKDEEVAEAVAELLRDAVQLRATNRKKWGDELERDANLIRRLHSSLAEQTREVEEARKQIDALNGERPIWKDELSQPLAQCRGALYEIERCQFGAESWEDVAQHMRSLARRALSHKAPGK